MNKTALQDIQQTLNIIRNQVGAVDADTKWAALVSMLTSSVGVVALAKKTKSDTKTVTRTISISKTKIIRQSAQQIRKTSANDAARTAIKPITRHKP